MKKLRIAFYGIGGVGKTTLCNFIVENDNSFHFYDGSTFIEENVTGGIKAFKQFTNEEKYNQRVNTVKEFGRLQQKNGKHLLASGHFSFINKDDFEVVWTHEDASFYTHIFYIELPSEVIHQQQRNDSTRHRPFTLDQIKVWAEFEKEGIKNACKNNSTKLHIINAFDLTGKYQQFKDVIDKEDLS